MALMPRPRSARVLGEALDRRSEMFVTGDAGLLRLGKIDSLPIASPR